MCWRCVHIEESSRVNQLTKEVHCMAVKIYVSYWLCSIQLLYSVPKFYKTKRCSHTPTGKILCIIRECWCVHGGCWIGGERKDESSGLRVSNLEERGRAFTILIGIGRTAIYAAPRAGMFTEGRIPRIITMAVVIRITNLMKG